MYSTLFVKYIRREKKLLFCTLGKYFTRAKKEENISLSGHLCPLCCTIMRLWEWFLHTVCFRTTLRSRWAQNRGLWQQIRDPALGQTQGHRRSPHQSLHYSKERQIRRLVRRTHHRRWQLHRHHWGAGSSRSGPERGQVVSVPRHCCQQGRRIRSFTPH